MGALSRSNPLLLAFLLTLNGCSSTVETAAVGEDCSKPLDMVVGQDNSIEVQKSFDACEAYLEHGGAVSADAKFYQGRLLYFSGLVDRALETFESAQELGSLKSTLALGYHLSIEVYDGDGSYLEYYKRAAEGGDNVARVAYAIELAGLPGDVSPEDADHAFELLNKAALEGYAPAEYYLGEFYNYPILDEKRDKEKARAHYELAAKGGVQDALVMLDSLGGDASLYAREKYPFPEVNPQDLILNRP